MRYEVKESKLFDGQFEVIDNEQGYTQVVTFNEANAELIAKILNDDENGISSVIKAWEQYTGRDRI